MKKFITIVSMIILICTSTLVVNGADKLPAPENLRISKASGSGINIYWNAVAGASVYKLQKATQLEGPYESLGDSFTGTSYTDRSIQQGKDYYYTVTAINNDGEGVTSEPVRWVENPRYMLLDFYDGNNNIDIGEVKMFNIKGERINYKLVNAYDPWSDHLPYNWSKTSHYLNDGNINTYYRFEGNFEIWGRVIVEIPNNEVISKVEVFINQSFRPKKISIYKCNSYNYNSHLKYRSNSGLNFFASASIRNVQANEKYTFTTNNVKLSGEEDGNNVNLLWSATDGISSYTVKRASSTGGPYSVIAENINETSYTDNTVEKGQSYYYLVTGSCNGNTITSNEIEVFIRKNKNLLIEFEDQFEGNAAKISEIKVYGKDGEQVKYTIDEAFDSAQSGNAQTWSKLYDNNMSTYALVNSSSQAGSGTWSRLLLSLHANDGISKVEVYTPDQQKPKKIIVYEANEYTFNDNVRNRSNDGLTLYGESFPKNKTVSEKHEITKGYLKAPIISSKLGSNSVILNWDEIEDATSYTVKRSITEDGPYSVIKENITDKSYTDNAVINGATYYYIVTASNNNGESCKSNEIRVKVNSVNYLLVEFFDHYDGQGAYISELEIIDKHGEKINYKPIKGFDSANNNKPKYWLDANRGVSKLSDGDIKTDFYVNAESNAGDGTWSRVLLELESNDGIGKVNAWTNTQNKPHKITVYETIKYDVEKNINNRNNEGLDLFGEAFVSNKAIAEKLSISKSYLSAPINFHIIGGNSQATLSWDRVESATGYNIKRSTSPKGPYTLVTSCNDNSYIDTTVNNGQTYYYVVTAKNGEGESSQSREVKVRVSAMQYLVVDILDHYDNTCTNINEMKVYDNLGQEIKYQIVDGFDSAVNGKPTSWNDSNTGKVSLNDNDINTSMSVNKSSQSNTNTWTRLVLDLQNNDGVSNVKLWTGESSKPVKVTVYDATNYNYQSNIKGRSNSGLNIFGEFFVKNSTSIDQYSVNKSYLNAPTDLMVSSNETSVNLQWNTVNGATGYNIKRSNTENGPYNVIAQNIIGLNYNDDSVVKGMTYYYIVTASNSEGESSASIEKKISVTSARYLIMEVYDHHDSDSSSLSEIEVFNTEGKKINYSIVEGYDSATNGRPYYWSNASNGKNKLYDDNYETKFIVNRTSTAGSGTWTRLVLDLQNNIGVGKVNVWTDSDKKPQKVVFYECKTYSYESNIKGRKNTGLDLYGEIFIRNKKLIERYTINKSYLQAPTNIQVTGGNANASITWNAVSGATSYTIKRATSLSGNYKTVAQNIVVTNYTDQAVENGLTYYYVVTANNDKGSSSNSEEVKAVVTATQYLVVEVYDQYGSNNADTTHLNEIEVFDGNGRKINYEAIDVFDSVTNGLPTYWNNQNYGHNKLNDDNKSTLCAIKSQAAPNSGSWMRFVLRLHSNSGISKVDVWTNSTNKPKKVSIYEGVSYDYNTNVKNRDNTGLILFGEITPNNNGLADKYTMLPQLPQAPSTLNVNEADGEVTLIWSNISNATSYNVKRAEVANGPYTAIAHNVKQTRFVDTTGANGTKYYYVVTAVNSAGESSNSKEISATPHVILPNAPISLTGKPASSSINLTWNTVSNANTYTVKRSDITGGPYTVVAQEITTAGYTDTGLVDGNVYYYVVTSTNEAGESNNSSELRIRAGVNNLNAPTNVTAVAGDQKVTLTWNIVNHATGYKVKRATVAGGPYADIAGGVLSNSFVDTNLINNTTYYYVIVATNQDEESDPSNEVLSAPGIFIPDPVQNVVGLAGDNKVTISWDVNDKADTYSIKRSLTGTGIFTPIAHGIKGTSYVDTTAVNNTSYYYVITAVNRAGESTKSPTILVIPKAKEGNRVILSLTMSNGMQKDYDLSQSQLVEFLNWYKSAKSDNAMPYFTIVKDGKKGPYINNKDYIIYEKILYFEINEYVQ